jgi:hypothetical protein
VSSRRWIQLSRMSSVARYAIGDVLDHSAAGLAPVIVVARDFAGARIQIADHTRARWLWYAARAAIIGARLRARCALAEFWESL